MPKSRSTDSLLRVFERLAAVPAGDAPAPPPHDAPSADQFEAVIVWLADAPMLPGRSYLVERSADLVGATVAPLKYKVHVETMGHLAATKLERDDVGVCQLELDRAIAFDPRDAHGESRRFAVLDPISKEPLGGGMLRFALRRSQNVHWQAVDIDKAQRAAMKGQKPCVLWFTGIPASGKSTIANLVERKLHAMGRHTYMLDGDNVRHGLSKDLGFTQAARVENIRRVAEVARLMADAGLIVLAAFISPFRSERLMARKLLPPGEFIEIFVDTPLAVAEARDPKGLYRKARSGQLGNFTGVDSPYEPPANAEIRIDGTRTTAEEAAAMILEHLRQRGF